MVNIKTLASIEQMILDELRDIREILEAEPKDSAALLAEINSRLANIESLIIEKSGEND